MRHLLLAALMLGSAVEPTPELAPPPLMISVTVQPRYGDPYQTTYRCEVRVSDPTSKTVGVARLVAATGRPEIITAAFEDYSLLFSVRIDSDAAANRAETLVVVRRDYKIVAQQQSTIALLPTLPRSMPAAQ